MAIQSRFEGIPEIIYGTSFKFDNSAVLVEAALKAGFRAVDTAGFLGTYREADVGQGIAAALASGTCERKDLYIQTKFSPTKAGRDPAQYPYDVSKPIPEQVAESIESSLSNLGVAYVDCLILHSLYSDMNDTLTAWRAMEALVPSKVASLGLSGTDLVSLRHIYEAATIKPRSVQNRFTHDTIAKPNPEMPANLPLPLVAFDKDVRDYCHQQGIVYAPWGELWGSLDVLDGPQHILVQAGEAVGISKEIACYACIRCLGGCQLSVLCGTTNEGRMRETLEGLKRVERFVGKSEENRGVWEGFVGSFRVIVDGV